MNWKSYGRAALVFTLLIFGTMTLKAQQKISGTIAAITEITPKAGSEADVWKAARYIQKEAGTESGCLLFSLSAQKEHPHTVVFYEIFKDQAALDGHKKQAHTQQFSKMLEGKVAENKVVFLNIVNTVYH